jgi:hypothetical protein
MTAPVASGWSGRRVGLAPTGKRRLLTAHTLSGRSMTERAFSDARSAPPSEPALYQSRVEGLVYARAIYDLSAGVHFYMHGLRRETDRVVAFDRH